MKGFKNSTKTQSGHGEGRKTAEHWSVPIARKAMGGIVAPLGGGMKPGGMGSMGAGRPIMPRPHVMPNQKPMGAPKMAKLARGGKVKLKGNPIDGNSLSHNTQYSEVEKEHPRPSARPGYKSGGKVKPKGGLAFTSAPMFGKDC